MLVTCWLLVMISKIKKLNKDFSKSFVMKDLGATKKILGMKITCDENGKKKKKKLWLS